MSILFWLHYMVLESYVWPHLTWPPLKVVVMLFDLVGPCIKLYYFTPFGSDWEYYWNANESRGLNVRLKSSDLLQAVFTSLVAGFLLWTTVGIKKSWSMSVFLVCSCQTTSKMDVVKLARKLGEYKCLAHICSRLARVFFFSFWSRRCFTRAYLMRICTYLIWPNRWIHITPSCSKTSYIWPQVK